MVALILPDAPATIALGRRLAHMLSPGTLLLLSGDLGAGKTTLVQGLAAGLGIAEPVTSPTFTLVADYEGSGGRLYHADLYRLDDPGAIESTGLFDFIDQGDALVVVEWPERYPHWPDTALRLQLVHAAGGRQVIGLPPEWEAA